MNNIPDSKWAIAKISARDADKTIHYNRAVAEGDLATVELITGENRDNTEDLEQKLRTEEVASTVAKMHDANQIFELLRRQDPNLSRSNFDSKITKLTSDQLEHIRKLAPQISKDEIEALLQPTPIIQNDDIKLKEEKGVTSASQEETKDNEPTKEETDTVKNMKSSITRANTRLNKAYAELAKLQKEAEDMKEDKEIKKNKKNQEKKLKAIDADLAALPVLQKRLSELIEGKTFSKKVTTDLDDYFAEYIPPNLVSNIPDAPPLDPAPALVGQGVQREFIKFGKLHIDYKKLKYQKILSVTDAKKRRLPWLKNTPVSPSFAKLIMQSKVVPTTLTLSRAECHLFERLATVGEVELPACKKKVIPDTRAYIAHLQNRIPVLLGEIEAGNDSKEVKNELSQVCEQLHIFGVMNRQQFKELMRKVADV